MAEFKTGDRIVKMSGAGAGKYGIVNSVGEHGTLNVTFDGERLPRYCDPERCGLVATNAVEFTNPNYRPEAGMRFLDENFSMFDPKVAKAMIEDARRKGVKVPSGVIEKARRAGLIANSRAANAVRNERIRAYPDGPGEWILVDAVGDEGVGRTTATDERGIKAQLADIAVRTYRWHRPEIVIMREKYYSNAARNAVARNIANR